MCSYGGADWPKLVCQSTAWWQKVRCERKTEQKEWPFTLLIRLNKSKELRHLADSTGRKHRLRGVCVYFTFYFDCLHLYCPNWVSPMGNSACFPRWKPAAIQSRYPTYGACRVFGCFHNPQNSGMDYGIFSVLTNVNACNCTRAWLSDTVRESALKVHSGRQIPCRTEDSNLRQRRAGPMLCELTYTPRPTILRNIQIFDIQYSSWHQTDTT